MSLFQKIILFFQIQDSDPEFNRKRINILSRQVPLMYGVLVVNMAAVAYTHFDFAPAYLTVAFPSILSSIILLRTGRYLRLRNQKLSDLEVSKTLRTTVFLAGALGFVFVIWALSLFNYGNAYTQGHLAFFICLTVMACIFCLIYLRQAAVLLAISVTAPAAFLFILSGQVVFNAIAINMVLIVGVMLYIMLGHYNDFKNLYKQKKTLVEQSNKLEILNSENQKLANLDSLTNLPNRRCFFSELETLTEQARATNKSLVVGMLDLDGFKPVNDIFGHQGGDNLLINVSERLCNLVGPDVLVSRLGGDEFGFIIKNPENDKSVLELGQRICEALRVPFKIKNGTVQVACTIGFADFPHSGDTPQELFERADYALYYSKMHSKGKPVLFSALHETTIRESSRIAHHLFDANLEKELSVVFQPIVDSQTGLAIGCESLARWNNPVLGIVPPDIFIPSAERAGIISNLTATLLKKSLQEAVNWPDDKFLSFNLSAIDLASPSAILHLMELVKRSEFPISRVVFEITESAVMQDYSRSIESLHYIKRLGAKIALDDFGTGYSSLSYVQRLPIDRIKIDRSFILEIENDKATRNIVHTIVDLCRNLELDCVVEGVETEEQLAVLQSLGCHMIQGYLFSKPLCPSETQEFLEEPCASEMAASA